MDSGISEIIGLAVGGGIAFYMAFDFLWGVLPDNILRRIDFKPFNCYVCFSGWLAIVLAIVSGFSLALGIAYVGFTVLSSWGFNRIQ